ncbi:MAG: hypothetical protein QMD09_05440 [Desulfatibacillaceae bacterium]|nr:hypothetical protein [Desulfatibacillaceae bacterium]
MRKQHYDNAVNSGSTWYMAVFLGENKAPQSMRADKRFISPAKKLMVHKSWLVNYTGSPSAASGIPAPVGKALQAPVTSQKPPLQIFIWVF